MRDMCSICIEKVRGEVGRFYLTTTLINLGLGCATAGVMLAWGMPNPYLWGTWPRFSITSLMQVREPPCCHHRGRGGVFSEPRPDLGNRGKLCALATIEGQIVQPLLVGRRLAVNPLGGISGIVVRRPVLGRSGNFAGDAGAARHQGGSPRTRSTGSPAGVPGAQSRR